MSKPKLLLADDSPTVQKVINLTFADRGLEVFTYSDGDSALADLERVKPDIVLADVHMPGTDGYKFCELLRSDEAFHNIPVLLLVGSFEPFDRDEALRVGANGHLTKPFTSIAELVSTVESLIVPSDGASTAFPASEAVDTSDIDRLYVQSFVETVEIPRDAALPADLISEPFDDDMIETSYSRQEPVQETHDSIYEESVSEAAYEDFEAESLIADSMPSESFESESEIHVQPSVSEHDPFAAVASDETTDFSDLGQQSETIVSSIDDDILELPKASDFSESASIVSGRAGTLTSLSPELIDQIVDKVVERLSEKFQDQSFKMGG